MISAWSTSSALEYSVSNIQVRLLTVLDIGGTIIKWKQEKNGDIENVKQKCLQCCFLQDDHKGFLEDIEVRLIDTQDSDFIKREFYWMRTLKTFYLDGLSIESDA